VTGSSPRTREPRDGIALRLLLFYGIRKGALRGIRFEHFDQERRRLEIFTKGEKTQVLPIGEQWIWDALAELTAAGVQPGHYLLPHRRATKRGAKGRQTMRKLEQHLAELERAADLDRDLAGDLQAQIAKVRETLRLATLPETRIAGQQDDRPMGDHGLHHLWYRWLERAELVEPGVASGRKMHAARHTAGQRVLDHTGNLKAVQTMLGHASIGTTGDSYTGWGDGRLDETLQQVLEQRSPSRSR
jgi:integrase